MRLGCLCPLPVRDWSAGRLPTVGGLQAPHEFHAWGYVDFSSRPHIANDRLTAVDLHVLNRHDLARPHLSLLKGEGALTVNLR